MSRRSASLLIVLLVSIPLLAGCGSLFGPRLDNFRAYYNTFYNAERDFERAERAVLRAEENIDRARFLSLFRVRPETGRGGDQEFENAIRRAADVLRDHPNSRWVDDALLLIGKAYFYQGNFDAAAQKFREVLTIEDARTRDEASLWLGRSLMEGHNYGDAAASLLQALDQEGVRPQWAAKMRLALGEIDVRRGALEDAVVTLRSGLDELANPELGARAAFLLGQAREVQGDFDGAAEAYELSLSLRPTPELIYAAELQRALALSRTGRVGDALDRLERMRRDDRYYQQRGEVEYVRARVLAAADESDLARDLFLRLLYEPDPAIRIDRIRGQLHYHLGVLYRDAHQDFPRAAAHFDTASTALRQTASTLRTIPTTREAVLDADRLAESFGSYAVVHARIAAMDSLLHLGGLDDDAFTEAIDAIAEQRRQEAIAAERDRRRIEDQQGFGGAPMAGGRGGGAGQQPNGAPTTDAGFLSYRNPVRVQENLIAFQTRWGDRPRVPNWRRRSAVTAIAMGGDEDDLIYETPSDAVEGGALGVFVDISAVPRDPESYESMRQARAVARYELGNVLFLTLNDFERAEQWYQRVIEEDADLPIVVRAQYALAEMYASLGDEERAHVLWNELSEMPNDDALVRASRQRLGKPAGPAPPDTAQVAEAQYAAAFDMWQHGEHAVALQQMLDIDERYPWSETAARARLAAGIIYTEWAVPDTVALVAVSPEMLLKDGTADTMASAIEGLFSFQNFLFTDLLQGEVPDTDGGDESDDLEPIDGEVDVPEPVNAGDIVDDEGSISDLLDEGDDFSPLLDAAGQGDLQPEARTDPPTAPEWSDGLGDPGELSERPGMEVRDSLSVEPEEVERSWLEGLYASIEEDFPGTRFAERASRLRLAIEEQRLALEAQRLEREERLAAMLEAEDDEPEGDDFGEDLLAEDDGTDLETSGEDGDPAPDTEEQTELQTGEAPFLDPDAEHPGDLTDPSYRPETPFHTGDETSPETLPAQADPGRIPGEVRDGDFHEEDLLGEEVLSLEEGGFSWAAVVTPRSFEARNRLVSFHNAGYRVALTTRMEEDVETFLVLVGQFATQEEALNARTSLPPGSDHDAAELIELSPDLQLQNPQDLLGR